MKLKTYSFRLPVDLIRKIEIVSNNKTEFITSALEQALNQELNFNTQNLHSVPQQSVHTNDEYLNRYIDRLEADIEFWKDKYEVLQLEYYDAVKDSIKRLDSKFERIMYSIDESKPKPLFESQVPLACEHNNVSQLQSSQDISNLKKRNPHP
ncbi:MAG: hypothetical protein QXX20_06880 [Candidatus Thermoplasmatota archaeon]